MKRLAIVLLVLAMGGWVEAGPVDYAFIPGTASVDIPHGPGLRANSQF